MSKIDHFDAKEDFVVAGNELGIREDILTPISYIVFSDRFQMLTKDRVDSFVVEELTPSEAMYSIMPRERRLVHIEADIKDFEENIFDPHKIASVLLQTFSSINVTNQPLNIYLDGKAVSFDLRQPAKRITIAIESESGFDFMTNSEDAIDYSQVQAVVLKDKVSGITPKDYLKTFPGSYCFVSNTLNGLQMEFDHLVGDGALISTVFRSILTGSDIIPNKAGTQHSNRNANILKLPFTSSNTRGVMQAVAKASLKLKGSNSHVLVTSTRRTSENTTEVNLDDNFNRIIPIPIDSLKLADEYDNSKKKFENKGENINQTAMGRFLNSIQLTKLAIPRSLVKFGFVASSLAPGFLVPNWASLTAFWPKIPILDQSNVLIKNPHIGSSIIGIYAATNMLPPTWGPVVVSRPSITLPGLEKHISSFSLSGVSPLRMKQFADALYECLEL